MIRVIIERHLKDEAMKPKLMVLLREVRIAVMHQPGFVTSETLTNAEDGREVLVLATWHSSEYWKAWETAEQRIALTDITEPLLSEDPRVRVYDFASTEGE